MSRIDLPSPLPCEQVMPWEPCPYVTGPPRYLPLPGQMPQALLWDAIDSRSSRRAFAPLSEHSLSALLWYSAKTRRVERDKGRTWESRPSPSAGGIHSIDLVAVDRETRDWRARLYDPLSHALREVVVENRKELARFVDAVTCIVDPGEGTIIWSVADWDKVSTRYVHGESLVWRDAGALLGVLYLVCEGLGLNCCAVGMTGDPMIPRLFGIGDRLVGVGGCIVGSTLPT
jgi:SagB-type dehydrogenase family enzyme